MNLITDEIKQIYELPLSNSSGRMELMEVNDKYYLVLSDNDDEDDVFEITKELFDEFVNEIKHNKE